MCHKLQKYLFWKSCVKKRHWSKSRVCSILQKAIIVRTASDAEFAMTFWAEDEKNRGADDWHLSVCSPKMLTSVLDCNPTFCAKNAGGRSVAGGGGRGKLKNEQYSRWLIFITFIRKRKKGLQRRSRMQNLYHKRFYKMPKFICSESNGLLRTNICNGHIRLCNFCAFINFL